MSEERKYQNALAVVEKLPEKGGRAFDYQEFNADLAGEVLELVANGGSLIRICKMEGMPGILTVRMWEIKVPEFARQMRVAEALRGKFQYEKRAALLEDVEKEIYKETKKGKKYMDMGAFDKFMKHSERFSMVGDREQDLSLRRAGEAKSRKDGAPSSAAGGVPKIEIKNPFKTNEEVDLEQYRVENFDHLEGEEGAG